MTLYLDTSAVVKLYADEHGSAATRRAVAEADLIASSIVTYTETRAALSRKYRTRKIDAAAFARSKAEFESDWKGFVIMPVDTQTIRSAGEFAEQFGLRAYDAVHLATANSFSRETVSQVRFACFNAALNRAASTLGLMPMVS
ncbi:MAG: type II toxin-antitoxin system VapC family toxin [Deltaproteobacteria bacterium]|nr:type II toxin-antitoxin system VapC family toxin [Deltaproteobacteria bacterium]